VSAHDIAADQLKCVRALSVILADGTLTMPQGWSIHTYCEYDPPIAPTLEGLFFGSGAALPLSELREHLGVYADRLGLVLTERPHGQAGMVGVYAAGMWQGVELRVWGPASVPAAAAQAQRAEWHLDLSDELLRDLAVRADHGAAVAR
jgi:hypothetical protein